ncbi:MAG: STAS domain-containing protein [Bacteriovoracaceae bacterium]|jgi:anti-sigma B factor antagonist|nr:STAS domain-containing protein [Bacteriovoracaceae bacterium]
MAMKAQIRTDSNGNITVHMAGSLDFENSLPLRKELHDLHLNNPTSDITIDMHSLDFVGSSGIGFFVETLQILNEKKTRVKLSNVKTEFLKVFKLYNFDAYQLLVDQFENDDTENLNKKFGNRKSTYSN